MGYQEYFQGHHQLISYDHIRKVISKGGTLNLSLVERSSIEAYLSELNHKSESLVDNVSQMPSNSIHSIDLLTRHHYTIA